VVLNSGYSIVGFDEPIQIALRTMLSKIGIGWIQFTFPERTEDSPVKDLYLSTGLLALKEVRRWASRRFSSALALFGISFGANIAIECALSSSVEFLLLVNTVFDYRAFREKQLGEQAFRDWERSGVTQIGYPNRKFPLGFRFIREADSQRLETRSLSIQCPVYAFQGTNDQFISVAHIERLATANPLWNAFLVPNTDHAFDKAEAVSFCVATIERLLTRPRNKDQQ
jgi:fermentation-respiration switch protein FrsA (DUF1100 family)